MDAEPYGGALAVAQVLQMGVFILIAARSGVRGIRRGDGSSLWVAATFGVLSLLAVGGFLLDDRPSTPVIKVVALGLAAIPYLLYRFVGSIQRAARREEVAVASLTALVAIWALVQPRFTAPGERPTVSVIGFIVALVGQWTVLVGFLAQRLWRGGRGQTRLVRRRMRALSLSSVGVALGVGILGTASGSQSDAVRLVVGSIGLLSAIGFAIAFETPPFLRNLWRVDERVTLQRMAAELVRATSESEVLRAVLPATARLVGGPAAAFHGTEGNVVLFDGEDLREGSDTGAMDVSLPTGVLTVDLRAGRLLIWSSAYAPFFGPGERSLLQVVAGFTNVAMERARAFDVERSARAMLERANTELRELDRMKDGFLTAVSHELRTPLASVLGCGLTLLRRGEELSAARRADLLSDLVSSARRLEGLLVDLLDLDSLARGTIQVRRRPTDLGRLIAGVTEDIQLGDRSLRFTETPVVAEVDSTKVGRIVDNLLSNAVKYTPPGSTIWVRLRAEDGGVLLVVEDDGPGIPDALKRSVFEPFRRGGEHPTPGTGVGLSLVEQIAELHGGRAWVEDRPGGGASFRVFLASPVLEPRPGAPTPDGDPEPAA